MYVELDMYSPFSNQWQLEDIPITLRSKVKEYISKTLSALKMMGTRGLHINFTDDDQGFKLFDYKKVPLVLEENENHHFIKCPTCDLYFAFDSDDEIFCPLSHDMSLDKEQGQQKARLDFL